MGETREGLTRQKGIVVIVYNELLKQSDFLIINPVDLPILILIKIRSFFTK